MLDELRREGKIRNIGISDVSIGEIGRAKAVTSIAAVQNEYSMASESTTRSSTSARTRTLHSCRSSL